MNVHIQKKLKNRLGSDPTLNTDLRKLMNLSDYKSTPVQIEKIYGENYATIRKIQDMLQDRIINFVRSKITEADWYKDPRIKKNPGFLNDVYDVMKHNLNIMKTIANNFLTYTVLKGYE